MRRAALGGSALVLLVASLPLAAPTSPLAAPASPAPAPRGPGSTFETGEEEPEDGDD